MLLTLHMWVKSAENNSLHPEATGEGSWQVMMDQVLATRPLKFIIKCQAGQVVCSPWKFGENTVEISIRNAFANMQHFIDTFANRHHHSACTG